ncbi:MAG: 2-oxo-4-hydroxy-4-carboxy-5-ureidoimidazoline decarboxylase [Silvibacterium sp.]
MASTSGATPAPTLAQWNLLPAKEAAALLLACCGSRAWAHAMAARRPVADVSTLLTEADRIWWSLSADDWDEAFRNHPRIGERIGERKATASAEAQSATWSAQEQARAALASDDTQQRLRAGNAAYEARFGRIYIVCATGKTAEEMLAILEQRLANDPATELREAAEQQRQITRLRIQKWLNA